MKKIIIVGILLVLALSMSVFANAAGTGTGFYTQLTFAQPATGSSVLDLALGNWVVNYTGAITVSSTNTDATLLGNFGGYVWKYESSYDNGLPWNEIGKLVKDTTALAGTKSDVSESNSYAVTVYANKLRISYDATLVSPGSYFSNASGSGTITAAVVPEPGAFLVLGSGLAGIAGMAFKRRKY